VGKLHTKDQKMSDEALNEDDSAFKKTRADYCDEFERLVRGKLEAHTSTERPFKAAIFAHSYPDPDAIGSMMGVAWMLQQAFGIESACFYHGEISHPQNKAMVNLLEPTLRRVDEEYGSEKYDLHILVDTVPKNAGVGTVHKDCINFDVVIDHHKDSYVNGFKGFFIHVKAGSCASIVFHMMESIVSKENWLNEDVDHDTKVATALIAGVVTDTEYMMSDDSTELEFEAFKKLFDFRDANSLRQIVFFKRPKSWIDLKACASNKAKIDEEGYAIVGLGLIPESQRDIISDMADEMVSWASVETAIAFAVVGGERVIGSVRSSNASVNVSELCKRLGGKYGTGGGKHGKGAYNYTLGGMTIDPDEDEDWQQKTWETYKDKEARRIAKLIRK